MYKEDQSYCGLSWFTVPRSWISDEFNQVCYRHDRRYADLGPEAYTHYNYADEQFIEDIEYLQEQNIVTRFAKFVFQVKKLIHRIKYL